MLKIVSDENEDMTEIYYRYKALTAEVIIYDTPDVTIYDTPDVTELLPFEPCRAFNEAFYRMIRHKR